MQELYWEGYEYEHRKRSRDWFLALGIIAVAGAIAASIYHNYVFAVFIVVSALALGAMATKKPKPFAILLDEKGIHINEYIFPYRNVSSFWIPEHEDGSEGPKLLFHSDKIILPIISIPIYDHNPIEIRAYLRKYMKEEELHEPVVHKLLERMGL